MPNAVDNTWDLGYLNPARNMSSSYCTSDSDFSYVDYVIYPSVCDTLGTCATVENGQLQPTILCVKQPAVASGGNRRLLSASSVQACDQLFQVPLTHECLDASHP